MVDIVETQEEILEDIPSTLIPLNEEQLRKKLNRSDLYSFIREKFEFASNDRIQHETIWLAALRAYRGVYSADELQNIAAAQQRNPGSSSAFVKISKTKVLASYGQILDVLFADDSFPLSVKPTTEPSGAAKNIFIVPDQIEEVLDSSSGDIIGFEGDGREIEAGATQDSLFAGLQDKLKGLLQGKSAIEGNSPSPEFPEFSPAEEAANEMNKLIQDQLEESNGKFALRKCTQESVIYGSGIIKGPLPFQATQHVYERDEDGGLIYSPKLKLTPKIQHVSIWNAYPDPDALNQDDMSFFIERHLMDRSKLRSLKRNLSFDKDAIDTILKQKPDHTPEDWEQQIRDNKQSPNSARYEILEYWGWLDEELAARLDLDFDQDKEIQVNVWVSMGEVLKVVINPLIPQNIPYHIVPYEEHPYQIWGIGVPENMNDSQAIINGHWRLAIDNLKFAGNVVFEVNQNQLVPGQDMTTHPGKIWLTQGGAPGQSIFATKYPDTSQSHMVAIDRARQFVDEETGIPSFSHGSTNVTGATRTSSGMSMLMAAASGATRTVIKNYDHYLLKPLGESIFHWNMQFNEENINIRGDINIVANGTSSLLQREVKSQRLLTFLQTAASNPATAPLADYTYILEEIAKSLDLDPEKVINSPERAKMFAELIQLSQQQAEGGPQGGNQQGTGTQGASTTGPQGQGGSGEAAAGANPADTSGVGGGNIGVGNVPQPGESTFSG